MGHHPIASEEGLRALARMRGVCTVFPEVTEAVDGFGHTSFRVRDKPFVMLGEGDDGVGISIKVEPSTQEHLIRDAQRFRKTAYIGQHGWVSQSLRTVEWDETEELVEEAYRRVAPPKLVRRLDDA